MKEQKHHYRNVFKSDHLGSADLEDLIEQGNPLVFTIKEVKQFKMTVVEGKKQGGVLVAGKKMEANIAYFKEPIKPMVLNATNSKIIKSFTRTQENPNGSSFVEDWSNLVVELYIDENVKSVSGGTTQGVRIRPIQPKVQSKTKPAFTEANFEKAKLANATREQIEKVYTITDEVYEKYLAHGTKE